MNCKECPHFRILYEPMRTTDGALWDLGSARCEKYNLITDFASHRKFDRLTCPEDEKEEQK